MSENPVVSLSIGDLFVLADATFRTLRIRGEAIGFTFTEECRERVALKVLDAITSLPISVEIRTESAPGKPPVSDGPQQPCEARS